MLSAGTKSGKGLASNVEAATAQGLLDLAQKVAPEIIEMVARYIQGSVKKITVKIDGVVDLKTNSEMKALLQNIVWLTGVDERKMGEFIVSYPENPLYLANGLEQQGVVRIVNFSAYSMDSELIRARTQSSL